jgi:hypothetical protein
MQMPPPRLRVLSSATHANPERNQLPGTNFDLKGLLCSGASSKIAGINSFANSILSSNLTAPTLCNNSSVRSSVPNVIAKTFAPFSNLFASEGAM